MTELPKVIGEIKGVSTETILQVMSQYKEDQDDGAALAALTALFEGEWKWRRLEEELAAGKCPLPFDWNTMLDDGEYYRYTAEEALQEPLEVTRTSLWRSCQIALSDHLEWTRKSYIKPVYSLT